MIETYPERLSLKYYEGIVVQWYNEEKKKCRLTLKAVFLPLQFVEENKKYKPLNRYFNGYIMFPSIRITKV